MLKESLSKLYSGRIGILNVFELRCLIGSIQVFGDMPTFPSITPNPNPKPDPTQTLGLNKGRVGMSPETWIDPFNHCASILYKSKHLQKIVQY